MSDEKEIRPDRRMKKNFNLKKASNIEAMWKLLDESDSLDDLSDDDKDDFPPTRRRLGDDADDDDHGGEIDCREKNSPDNEDVHEPRNEGSALPVIIASDYCLTELDQPDREILDSSTDSRKLDDGENEIVLLNAAPEEQAVETNNETADGLSGDQKKISYSPMSVKKAEWRHGNIEPPQIPWEDPPNDQNFNVPDPLELFSNYIPHELFEEMADKTNKYARDKKVPRYKDATVWEIIIMFALNIICGCLKLPRIRMYWDKRTLQTIFPESMHRNRFFQLRNNLHLVDVSKKAASCTDRLWKVRPIFDSVRKRCLMLVMILMLCIDEQIVPFEGQVEIKQYMKSKPTSWGIKLFLLCDSGGLVYDFLIYQGKWTPLDEALKSSLGYGGAVVAKLCERICAQGHQLFFDNYFSSYNLFLYLLERHILAAGTVRMDSFGKPPLKTKKEMSKEDRGYCEEVVSKHGVSLVAWNDTRPVFLASNFVGEGVPTTEKKWSKKNKTYVNVTVPEIVTKYNESMGGVDLHDMLISLYRNNARKWPLKMIFHAVNMALVNSWIEYKRAYQTAHGTLKGALDYLYFRFEVASKMLALAKAESGIGTEKKKRARPSTIPPSASTCTLERLGSKRSAPCNELEPENKKRRELFPAQEPVSTLAEHLPIFDDKTLGCGTRCKNILVETQRPCGKKTNIFCKKCDIALCIQKTRNCFLSHHEKMNV